MLSTVLLSTVPSQRYGFLFSTQIVSQRRHPQRCKEDKDKTGTAGARIHDLGLGKLSPRPSENA